MNSNGSTPLAVLPITKRRVWAQILVCEGCCCGHAEKGYDPVPSQWLREQWQKHKLMYEVDLTIPYCLGPCDMANVACILLPDATIWLGALKHEHYALLFEWALSCKRAAGVLPLPSALMSHRFPRFRDAKSAA